MKRCTGPCGKKLPYEMFYLRRDKDSTRRHAQCKACIRAGRLNHYYIKRYGKFPGSSGQDTTIEIPATHRMIYFIDGGTV